jgi:type I restriction enzyme S subunit
MTQLIRLGDFTEVGAGNSAPQNENLFKGGSLPFIRTSDVGAIHVGSIETSRDLLTLEGAKGLRLQPAGTILFPKSGASTFLNHRVVLGKSAYVSSHLATIKANNDLVLDRYLFYFLQTIDARDLCQDQSYPSLNRDQIAGIEVPVPSLNKQNEIVEKLDSAFAEIDILEKRIEIRNQSVDQLIQSLLSDAFGTTETETAPHQELPIGEICEVGDGNHSSKYPTKNEMISAGVPFIRAQNIVNGTVDDNHILYISKQKHETLRKGHLNAGDILITNRGEIGKLAIVPPKFQGSNLNSQIAWLRCGKQILNSYLFYFLKSENARRVFDSGTSGSTLQQLTISKLKKIKVPIIPLSDQAVLVKKLDSAFAEIELLNANNEKSKSFAKLLRQSLLGNTFSLEKMVG